MSETAQAYSWIYATCIADTALMAVATGGVWQGFADLGVTAPYVLIFPQDPGTDTLTANANRLFTRGLFQIKMVGPAAMYTSLVTGADCIDDLFKSVKSVALSPSGGILCCYRERELSYPELVNGAHWENLGGLYNIDVQAN